MDQPIQAKKYLDSERIDISLLVTDEKITFKSSLLTARSFVHILMTVGMLLSLAFIREAPLIVIAIVGIILYVIWQDFESINNIVIYQAKKEIVIRRYNVIKKVLLFLKNKKDQYPFGEIKQFEVYFDEYPGTAESKYLVNLILENEKKINLLSTQKEKHASYIANLLAHLTTG